MNPDQLAFSGFEQDLRQDTRGILLKEKTEYIQQQLHQLNTRINAGQAPGDYEALTRLKQTLTLAEKALSGVWHGLHG